ncbi:hypothetical protein [Nocardia testacea]|uniref:hypothetical protein n=1 Tax=Nocardia testacea TaxID=248551 RepID=UPI00031DFC58|nr:hypothetical protein [Nocardia testacea]
MGETRKRRRLAAALRVDRHQPALGLLFNVDTEGHEYAADLLDLAADTDGNS